jgi:hypothetical protein
MISAWHFLQIAWQYLLVLLVFRIVMEMEMEMKIKGLGVGDILLASPRTSEMNSLVVPGRMLHCLFLQKFQVDVTDRLEKTLFENTTERLIEGYLIPLIGVYNMAVTTLCIPIKFKSHC